MMFSSDRHGHSFFNSICEALLVEGRWQGEIWTRHKNGAELPQWLSINHVYDENEQTAKHVALFSPVAGQRPAEQTRLQQNILDPHNLLPNRQLFWEHLDREIKRANEENISVGLLGIDLDKFTLVSQYTQSTFEV
jgi:GGDEF domain-containing protein